MSQVHHAPISQPIPMRRAQRYIAVAVLALVFFAAATFAVAMLSSSRPAPTVGLRTQQQDLVDGWTPGMAAARAASLARAQDGYLPGLLAARGSGDAVDGYLPGLLAARGSGDAVDGWESSLTRGGTSSDARDGWESGLLH